MKEKVVAYVYQLFAATYMICTQYVIYEKNPTTYNIRK